MTSAGTFSSKEADRAWQRADAEVGKGRDLNLKRGRQTFKKYVEETWLPNHEVEPSTMQSYHYSIYKHVIPEFGAMRMMDIRIKVRSPRIRTALSRSFHAELSA
ncbi:hypothetical protein [Actinomadura nitritigenes]|uniref:hypothetical protein n=1 Tax=Actinomadura nitritigenes TaxID=134602 RepID=UPI003D8A2024